MFGDQMSFLESREEAEAYCAALVEKGLDAKVELMGEKWCVRSKLKVSE